MRARDASTRASLRGPWLEPDEAAALYGNGAVAEYYGRLVSSAILGVSIVVAAAVLGGVIAALH